MGKNGGVGCAIVLGVVFIIGLILWVLAAALWLLGLLVAIGAVIGAVALIGFAWKGVAIRREATKAAEEIERLAQDSARDLRNLQFRWSDAVLTKGLGTPLAEQLQVQPSLGERRRREIEAMIVLVEQAPAAEQRLEAVSMAEALRIRVEKQLEA